MLLQELTYLHDTHYSSLGLSYNNLTLESESNEYGACDFELNGVAVKFRIAKITPTKVGQFVTLWKRIGNGPIQPFDSSDPIDLFIIQTRHDENFGQFVFPKAVLCEEGVLSHNHQGGKRAIRVYPPWDKNLNRQAQKTQQWQVNYFLDIPCHSSFDRQRAKRLYCTK